MYVMYVYNYAESLRASYWCTSTCIMKSLFYQLLETQYYCMYSNTFQGYPIFFSVMI